MLSVYRGFDSLLEFKPATHDPPGGQCGRVFQKNDKQRQMLHLRFRGTGDVYRYFEGLGKENLAEVPEKCFPDYSRHRAIRK